jgi:hypothetical protein
MTVNGFTGRWRTQNTNSAAHLATAVTVAPYAARNSPDFNVAPAVVPATSTNRMLQSRRGTVAVERNPIHTTDR